jgi:hypothetical protein
MTSESARRNSPRARRSPLLLVLAAVAIVAGCEKEPAISGKAPPSGSSPSSAQPAQPPAPGAPSPVPSDLQAFDTPEAGADALVTAVRTENISDLKRMLGNDIEDVLSSGDDVIDKSRRAKFVELYDQKHSITKYEDGTAVLIVGPQDWPMPIPLVQSGGPSGKWRFDDRRGRDEIVARRVGENELDAIETCRAVVDAQKDYFAVNKAFAMKFLSDEGQRNGLYWPTPAGEAVSPLGELVAQAATEGYTHAATPPATPRPFHGYCYRMLTAQGPAAPGGARSYLAGDKLSEGFAVLAYPVNYGHSGVMTFITNQNGIVYERDLGDDTEKLAQAITAFDPDTDWTVSEEPEPDATP